MSLSTFSFPTRVLFGAGAVKSLPAELERSHVQRPLLVTDKGIVNTPLVDGLRELLRQVAIFSGVDPNPTEKNVLEGVAFYRQHNCDGIIALGGGSPIDAAKAIRLIVNHPLDLSDYDDNIGGDAKITPNMPPNIAVPTTAGTGSEVGRSSVITITATNRKTVIFSPYLIPDLAVVYPELTLQMPPKITAGTGMDAFTHNIEAYLAKTFHPFCDAIALRGVKIVVEHLPRVMRNPGDIESRGQMMMAAMMGAIAFQKGLGAVHSLAHPLSSEFGMHHGTSNAVLLGQVLDFNRSAVPKRFAELHYQLGKDVSMCTSELNSICGISPQLRDYGIPADALPSLAEKAMKDGCHLLNPRPCSREDLLTLYQKAW